MSTELHAFTVPPLTRGLSVLSTYMDKATGHARMHGIDLDVLFNARLAPDMAPLSAQVQMAGDKAKNGVARLVGIVAPSYSDTEASFEELKARIAKTREFVETITPADFEGAGERQVEHRYKSLNRVVSGYEYLTKALLPDFYFHIATAHDILRHNGLEIGKADYIGYGN